MPSKTIDQLIINSPYDEPAEHWKYDRESRLFSRVPGRRPAGYVRASESSKTFDDPGIFVELPLPNKIRPRVNAGANPAIQASAVSPSVSWSTGATPNSEKTGAYFSASSKPSKP